MHIEVCCHPGGVIVGFILFSVLAWFAVIGIDWPPRFPPLFKFFDFCCIIIGATFLLVVQVYV